MSENKERLLKIQAGIREAALASGRAEASVQLVAVSKTKSWEDIKDFLLLGVSTFGENYIQEALPKIKSVGDWCSANQRPSPTWHFIGHLQSNKSKQIPRVFSLFHALDSFSLAEKLNRAAAAQGVVQDCLLEVNVDAEVTKNGLAADGLSRLLQQLNGLESLRVTGLMCIPAPGAGGSRPAFARLRELRDEMNKKGAYHLPLAELSMGMSGDFKEAILEGATIVRVGTSLFGERT